MVSVSTPWTQDTTGGTSLERGGRAVRLPGLGVDGEAQRRCITWTSLCFLLTGVPSHMLAGMMKNSDWRRKQGGTMAGIVFLTGGTQAH